MSRPSLHTPRFTMVGSIARLVKADERAGWTPSRPFGGWLTVFALLGPTGGVVPVVDRQDQVMEAAAELGRIDWSSYLRDGVWNDTHRPGTVVGIPTSLEFHDGTSDLSRAHGKIGFWTSGHLLDRGDPDSWRLHLPRTSWPSPRDLDRADYFWDCAELLKGTPRPLGLSAEGLMALSSCKRRILFAKVTKAAVCELPVNPASTAEPAALPFADLAKGMTDADPCATCSCPAGLRCALAKGADAPAVANLVPQDLEGVTNPAANSDDYEATIRELMARGLSRERAALTVARYRLHTQHTSPARLT